MADSQILMAFANQHRGDLDGLLTAFFKFLHERTDLYVVDENPKQMGFRPGQAETKVLNAFRSFPYKMNPNPTTQQPNKVESTRVLKEPTAQVKEIDKKQVPVGNGGRGPGYTWTQTLTELNVILPVLKGTRGKDIDCVVKSDSVRVYHRLEKRLLLEGSFPPNETVDVEESSWTLDGDESLLLILIKRRESWWTSVVRGHPEIDATKVDSTKKVSEYDPETQSAIRKLIAEQQEKGNLVGM